MIRTVWESVFVCLFYVLLPALFMHIDGTSGAVVDSGSGVFVTDGTFHQSLPPLSVARFADAVASDLPSLPPLESVT